MNKVGNRFLFAKGRKQAGKYANAEEVDDDNLNISGLVFILSSIFSLLFLIHSFSHIFFLSLKSNKINILIDLEPKILPLSLSQIRKLNLWPKQPSCSPDHLFSQYDIAITFALTVL